MDLRAFSDDLALAAHYIVDLGEARVSRCPSSQITTGALQAPTQACAADVGNFAVDLFWFL